MCEERPFEKIISPRLSVAPLTPIASAIEIFIASWRLTFFFEEHWLAAFATHGDLSKEIAIAVTLSVSLVVLYVALPCRNARISLSGLQGFA